MAGSGDGHIPEYMYLAAGDFYKNPGVEGEASPDNNEAHQAFVVATAKRTVREIRMVNPQWSSGCGGSLNIEGPTSMSGKYLVTIVWCASMREEGPKECPKLVKAGAHVFNDGETMPQLFSHYKNQVTGEDLVVIKQGLPEGM